MRSIAARSRALDGRLRSPRHIQHHFECFNYRLLAHIASSHSAKTAFTAGDPAVARRDRKMNKTDRLTPRRAAGAGNPGNGHRKADIGFFQRADRHCGRSFLAYGAEGRKRRRLDTEHRLLRLI